MSRAKVAVIGSGFGGLATAIRLQSSGFDVTIFEKRDIAGGRAYVYRDNGFVFDAGPTVITAPDCLRELFELSQRRMEDYVDLIPISPLYRLHWESGYQFDYTADLDSTLQQIAKKSPADVQGYQNFLKYTEEVFEQGYTKLAHVPFLDWASMFRAAPQLVKLQAFRTVYSMVGKYIQDPELRQAFSFHSLLVGGNPFAASSIYTLIHFLERKWGVYFARGGTAAMVQSLCRLFEELGGRISLNAEINEITTREGKVTGIKTLQGKEEAFDAVVSNADVYRTYFDLLKRESAADAGRKKMQRSSFSNSLFVIYFGTKKRYPGMAHHNVIFGPRYREHLKDIFHRGVLADDFSLYLHVPTVTDPSVAPEGCENFYVLSCVPHMGKYGGDWKEESPKYADKILSYLEARYLPDLKRNIIASRTFSPLDFKTELNAHLGSAFSMEPLLTQSAFFRTHNRDRNIEGLYFVGAGTHPGAGIPGVVNSAKATSGLVIEDFKTAPVEIISRNLSVTSKTQEPLTLATALTDCREMITKGSKSFSMAARFFAPQTRDAAFFLYGWCRYCDDQVDETMNLRLQEERVELLRHSTRAAFQGEKSSYPAFTAIRYLAQNYQIPSHYPEELIEGMAMDVRKERYETVQDLSLYCYRVAGVVGLMMSHVMGVSDTKALRHAADLGSAMQMTNIARDVMEDAQRQRVYLPLDWLDEAGIPEGQLSHPKYREAVAVVVARLLSEADSYYHSGIRGLKYLPWRSAFAVAIAARVYREIGRRVIARGPRAWDTRTVVSPLRKAWAVVEGLGLVVTTIPYRLLHPWKRTAPLLVWRHGT